MPPTRAAPIVTQQDAQGRLLLHPHSLSPSSPAAPTCPRSEMHIDDVGAPLPRRDVLIPPSSPSPDRLLPADAPPLSSAAHLLHSPQSVSAIQPTDQNNLTHYPGQHVLAQLSSLAPPSSSSVYQPQLAQHVSPAHYASELSYSPTAQHAQVAHAQHRPRTTHPVFGNTSKLAQHYGIPTRLPPTPRIGINESSTSTAFPSQSIARHPRPPVPRFDEQQPKQHSPAPAFSSSDFIQSYLSMLNSKPEEPSSSMASTFMNEPSMAQSSLNDATAAALFGGAHDFTSPMWTEFLTSPMPDEDTPFDSLLDTPAQGSDLDFLTSPVVVDLGDQTFSEMPLFAVTAFPTGDDSKFSHGHSFVPPASVGGTSAVPPTPITPATHDFDSLIPLSPATPALDPPSAQVSPLITANNGAPKSRRVSKAPNGTRRNLKAEDLIPVEAPTQVRNYLAPSATSRKEVPAIFARKRARSALDEGEDELDDFDADSPLPAANEKEAIAAKRRQNTLAARRSRKRKLEYQQEIEEQLEELKRKEAMWKDRATSAKRQLMHLGFPEPWSDD